MRPARRRGVASRIGRPLTGESLDDVGEGGDVVGGVRLQRTDVMPPGTGHRIVHVAQLSNVVLPDQP